MSSTEEEATISIPSIVFVAVLGFIIYRYFFASRGGAGANNSSRNSQRFTQAQVDQIAQMFPQLSRRDIMWDLHRNRGSVPATTERVLMGRGLDPAPPTFQPPEPIASAASTPLAAVMAKMTKPEIDLITRYNLQERLNSKGKEKEEDPVTGWPSTKDQRQATLQRRRDEMILAARRKMQERDAQSPLPPAV